MKLSIIVPVYNEEKTLEQIYKRIKNVDFGMDLEIIFVDDCSKDKSREIIGSIVESDSAVKKFFKKENGGKGSAIQEGIKQASGDFVIIQDADLEYDPNEIPSLLELLKTDRADVVYGSRFSSMSTQVVRFYHYLGNKFLTLFSNLLSDIRLTDMETCYKCFRADIIQNIVVESMRFGFEPEVTAKISKLSIRIHEVPISYQQRSYSEGKKIGIMDGFEALWCILKYNLLANKEAFIKPEMPEKYLKNFGLLS